MGIYINKGNNGFRISRNGEYIDKSGLIAAVNATLDTEQKFSCVSRSRRFGKSMAAKMLAAYYDQSCDSRNLFTDLEIANDPSFERHLNKYPVIYVDMTDFVTRFKDIDIVEKMQEIIMADISEAYPDVAISKGNDLMDLLINISHTIQQHFILIIDEWDAILREFSQDNAVKDKYVDLLRRMFKSVNANDVFVGVYMTGILPIKKYKTQSALNNFIEYSMVTPRNMAHFFGFTKDEVRQLADRHGMDFDELEKWYDGYQIGAEVSMFNPNSVMQALYAQWCESYWGKTASYDAVASYIDMNYDGLKDDIVKMLAGGRCAVDPTGFLNDIAVIKSKDDVLTLLIHLGYLSYERVSGECYIPNREVAGEMEKAVRTNNWKTIVDAIQKSRDLLRATLEGDEESVAKGIDAVHDENTSILSYNNENSLACVLSLAYYYAMNNYIIPRELASGKGFADIVMVPRKNIDSPAIIVELKYDHDADAAIDQIKKKQYPAKLQQYSGNLLLVGINYNKKTRTHTCHIERIKTN